MKQYILLGLLFALQLFFLLNLRFTVWPEMLSYPYLRNNQFLLYLDMIHPYPPILTLGLSVLFKLTGYQVLTLKAFTLILALSNTTLLYFIAKRIDKTKALLVAAFYVALQPFMEGNMLWFDFVIATPLLAAFLCILKWKNERSIKLLVCASVLLTIAGLIKQTGGLFFIIFILWLVSQKLPLKQFVTVVLAPLLLFAPLLIRLLQEQALQGFINWVIVYPAKYWSAFPGYVQMQLTESQIFLLVILLMPYIFLLQKILFKKTKDKSILVLLALFIGVGLLAIYPRFSYFHLQTVLPFLVLSFIFLLQRRPFVILVFTVISSVFFAKYLYKPVFAFDWKQPTRFHENRDLELADKIKSLTKREEKIFLFGIQSGIYVYSDRLPAKPWGDNFGWYYEIEDVEESTIKRWQEDPPIHIFWRTPNVGNWFDLGVYQPKQLASWIESNYEKQEEIFDEIWHWRIKK